MRENTKKSIHGRHGESLKVMEMFLRTILKSECFLNIMLFSKDNCTTLGVKEINPVPVSSSMGFFIFMKTVIHIETSDA